MAFLKTAQSLGVRGFNKEGKKKLDEIVKGAPKNQDKDGSVKSEDVLAYQSKTDIRN